MLIIFYKSGLFVQKSVQLTSHFLKLTNTDVAVLVLEHFSGTYRSTVAADVFEKYPHFHLIDRLVSFSRIKVATSV